MHNLVPAPGTDYAQTRNDAFGRPIETLGLDGKVRSRTRYRALSVDRWDAEDIGPGPHQGTYASEHQDGFGRTTRTTVRVREGGVTDLRHLDRTYLPTGELTSLVRWHGGESTHVPGPDAVTRTMGYDSLGRMIENFEPSTSEGTLGWRYVYDDSGRLVGTSDARGCGVNFSYDAAGRLLTEDYSPCEVHHVPYSPSPEVQYHYDLPDPEADAALPGVGQTFTLTSVRDRASKVLSRVDLRGRVTHTAKKIAAPDGSFDTRWYHRESTFDAADRPVRATGTTTAMVHDDLRRLRNLTTFRSNQPTWTNDEGTQQMLLQDTQLVYDRAGNPTEIRDWRMPQEWEPGAKPVSRKMEYDDLYRLKRIDYQHTNGDATWVDPFDAEMVDPTRAQPSPRRSFSTRVLRQTFAYDWLGNTIHTDDDQHGFYDRSLGPITNDVYAMTGAGSGSDNLVAEYDVAGYLTSLVVNRTGDCIPAGACLSQRFEYQWDEVGRLVEARRWDGTEEAAHLEFAYDASDMRVRKTSRERHTVYVFGSLELRSALFVEGDYELSESTEVAYLDGRARVVNNAGGPRVFMNLGDHLGSNALTIDLGTGELVQRSTSMAFGAQDSSYRPSRWESFREEYRFTGKEDDIELGLVYFGKRYYAPMLGRWISADPLAVHVPGRADLNVYAYVHGMPLAAVDPVGLEPFSAILIGAAIGAGIGMATNAGMQVASGQSWDWGSLGRAGLTGAASGAATVGMGAALGVGSGVFPNLGESVLMQTAGGYSGGLASGWLAGKSGTELAKSSVVGGGLGAASGLLGGAAVGLSPPDPSNSAPPVGGHGSVGEAFAVGAAGAALGYGTARVAGAGENLRAIGALSGGLNGTIGGARGIYDWESGSGELAFFMDSTWGLGATTLGNLFVGLNELSGADYVSGWSHRQNRQIYQGPNSFTPSRYGLSLGNTSAGVDHDDLHHETIHIWQARFFGPFYLSGTVGTWVGGAMVLVLRPGTNPSFETAMYFNSPFEAQAYQAEGKYPPSIWKSAEKELMWW